MNDTPEILSVQDLDVSYGSAQVLQGVSLTVGQGEIVGIVGESGSGKSTLLRAVARLLPVSARIPAGSIAFAGRDIVSASAREMRAMRGSQISYLFQNAQQSFDPLFTIGKQFDEVMRAHEPNAQRSRRRKLRPSCPRPHGVRGQGISETRRAQTAALRRMGFDDPDRILCALPSELSGGMAQRVALAFALAGSPSLLLADEPTSALDGDAQCRVLELLRALNEQDGLSILVVSHDIDLVASLAHRIIVMRKGRIVEEGKSGHIMESPQHPYTRQLIAAIPRLRNDVRVERLGGGHAAGSR